MYKALHFQLGYDIPGTLPFTSYTRTTGYNIIAQCQIGHTKFCATR